MLAPHLDAYLDAFFTLSPGRQLGGFGPGGITMVDLLAYCAAFNVPDAERFVRMMRALDAEFLSWAREKATSGAQ